jgi:phenylpyruvate tautomerase PptA (4-oxalocrotonate tautomerase family)
MPIYTCTTTASTLTSDTKAALAQLVSLEMFEHVRD